MAFIKRDVKDRVVQYPRRYQLVEVSQGIYDLVPVTGTVIEEGTAINKAYLQPIEDALGEAATKEELNSHLEKSATPTEYGHIRLVDIPIDNATIFRGVDNKLTLAPPFSTLYFYNLGVEDIDFVGVWNPTSAGSGTQSKNADHLRMTTAAVSFSKRGYVTQKKINVTLFSTIYIEWENIGADHVQNRSMLQVGPNILTKTQPFTKRTDSLDVSSLKGFYTIAVEANNNNYSQIADLKVYKIWGVI